MSHNLWSTEHSGHHVYTGGPAGGCAGYWQPAPSGVYGWYPNVPSDSYAVTFNLVLDAARTRHGPSYGADAFNISSSCHGGAAAPGMGSGAKLARRPRPQGARGAAAAAAAASEAGTGNQEGSAESIADREIKLWRMRAVPLGSGLCPLLEWKSAVKVCPWLGSLDRRVLAIPATSAAPERCFHLRGTP